MNIEHTEIRDLVLLTPVRHGDARGFFSESWNRSRLEDANIDVDFVQDNHSLSAKAGTIRGLHFQAPPHAQAKLVRCGRGAIYDVAVDIRRGSPTFGRSFGAELSFENGRQLYVPEGFLHGFMTLMDDTEIVYKCSDYYAPQSDGSVLWSSCGIDWPPVENPTLSDKDAQAIPFEAFQTPFEWETRP